MKATLTIVLAGDFKDEDEAEEALRRRLNDLLNEGNFGDYITLEMKPETTDELKAKIGKEIELCIVDGQNQGIDLMQNRATAKEILQRAKQSFNYHYKEILDAIKRDEETHFEEMVEFLKDYESARNNGTLTDWRNRKNLFLAKLEGEK